jgi:hypothetical protein
VEGEGGGQRAGGRNDPNNVCTYEYMNKEKKETFPSVKMEGTH